MHRTSESSREAYYEEVIPNMGSQHRKVLIALLRASEPLTNKEIAREELGWETSTVSGRVRELIDDRILVDAGKRECRISGRTVRVVKLANQVALTLKKFPELASNKPLL